MAKTRVLHEPQLNTILMVENAIKEAESYPTRKELWGSLPKKFNTKPSNVFWNISKVQTK